MRIAATAREDAPERAQAPAPAKRDFARHLKVSKKADDQQEAQPTDGQAQAQQVQRPQTLGQIVITLLGSGAAQPHPAVDAIAKAQAHAPAQIATDAVAATLAATVAKPEVPKAVALTPLEQAVHDMLAELTTTTSDDREHAPKPELPVIAPLTAAAALEAPDAPATQPAAPIAPAQTPAELVSQHHAHIVLDEPGLRVVMTVAVRGSDVNVNVRSSDEQTAAALARNAGSLDEAMRGRKLELHSFSADHDREHHKHEHERKSAQKASERFSLEETV